MYKVYDDNRVYYENQREICNDNTNGNFFPQFYPMHNHDDYKATNNGVYPGGQLTFIQVDK